MAMTNIEVATQDCPSDLNDRLGGFSSRYERVYILGRPHTGMRQDM
jgi:hypothetical protein